MAFPATYDFNYYRGDTFELKVYPKDSAGNAFSLVGYQPSFAISTARGAAGESSRFYADAVIVNNEYVKCAILPRHASSLSASVTQFVYDIEVRNPNTNGEYPLVYTLMTGTITTENQVGTLSPSTTGDGE